MSLFEDQKKFMTACEQSVSIDNASQFAMHCDLIREEVKELHDAIEANDDVEQLDAIIDILVVTIGAGLSRGWDLQAAWDEVMRTNLAKIDPVTGKVRKREDGKVLKPEGWKAPDLTKIAQRMQ